MVRKSPDAEALRREAAKRINSNGKGVMVASLFNNVGSTGVSDVGTQRGVQNRRATSPVPERRPVLDALGLDGTAGRLLRGTSATTTSTTAPKEWTYDHVLPQVRVTSSMAANIAAYGNQNGLTISSAVRELIQGGLDTYKENT